MEKLLYINSCIDRMKSRTNRLACSVIDKMQEEMNVDLTTIILEDMGIRGLNKESVAKRTMLCKEGAFDDSMFDYARQFAEADYIVIAAPYWDLSFPSILKDYIENVCVCGLTFAYGRDGRPIGLCKAKRLIYVTTSGGFIGKFNLGYEYIKDLCNVCFEIKDTQFISAEGLDIAGNDSEGILENVMDNLDLRVL